MGKVHHRSLPRKRESAPGAGPAPVPVPEAWETRVALIQALIPIGLDAVHELLQAEVTTLVGARYSRQRVAPDRARYSPERFCSIAPISSRARAKPG